jgi:Tfp pilus assembly protein PilE
MRMKGMVMKNIVFFIVAILSLVFSTSFGTFAQESKREDVKVKTIGRKRCWAFYPSNNESVENKLRRKKWRINNQKDKMVQQQKRITLPRRHQKRRR